MADRASVPDQFNWIRQGANTRQVASVADLARHLHFRSDEWQPSADDARDRQRDRAAASTLVWRGVGDRTWPLHPSLYRRALRFHRIPTESQVRKTEAEILYSARKAQYGERNGRALTDLELLAVLQHHGAATRLLDVTRNVLVALWFATQPVAPQGASEPDGALFGIDVTGRTLSPRQEAWTIDGLTRLTGLWHWEPPPLEQRIRAQQGSFVLSRATPVTAVDGSLLTSLDLKPTELEALMARLSMRRQGSQVSKAASRALIVFVVPGWAKHSIRDELGTFFGQDERSIYPDMSGFARSWGANS